MATPWYQLKVPDELLALFREYISDSLQYNEVLGGDDGKEAPDSKLRMALQQFVSKFNTTPPIVYALTPENFPNGSLLFKGALAELLPQLVLLHTRNRITHSDQGLQYDQWDKAPEYMQMMQVLRAEVEDEMRRTKIGMNAEGAYGEIGSPDRVYDYSGGC